MPVTARPVPKTVPEEFRFIAGGPSFPDNSRKVPRVDLLADLEFLEVLLANVYFQGLSNVTLLGTTSGGGSGRMTSYTLPRTRTTLTLCQMASFRANGDQFDGRGVTPDVVVEPRSEDFLVDGPDSVLEAALARLRR